MLEKPIFTLFCLSCFVVFCNNLSDKSDKLPVYNPVMEYLDKYIPKELLALKINYCKKRLRELPKVSVCKDKVRGIQVIRLRSENHRFKKDSSKGQELYEAMLERENLEQQLKVYEAIWDYYYRTPPPEYDPPKVVRTLRTNNNGNIVMDKAFFDSLKNDANTKYPKPMVYSFNGIQYRSAYEKEAAMYYTENGILFKYEPELHLFGAKKPQYPDFVLYFPELDTCKIHEHLGLMNYSNYALDLKLKCSTYTDAGLLIDQDVFFTYSNEDQTLDTRYLAAKVNTSIFGSLVCSNDWIGNIDA